jgi:beta-lactamase class A
VGLSDDAEALLAQGAGLVGLYARNVGSNESIEVGHTDPMPAESAAKTFILVHYSRLVNEGAVDPDGRVPYTAADLCLGSGVLRYLSPGVALTLDDLAWLMVIVSDNVATHLVLNHVGGPDAVNERMAQLGLPTARLNPRFSHTQMLTDEPFATATPKDLAEIYVHLDDRCREKLFRQQFTDYLPRRLPHASGATDFGITMPVRVFNKTGGGFLTCTDSGLFETDEAAWVAAAMASNQQDFASRADDSAPTLFATFGELLYRTWGTTAS